MKEKNQNAVRLGKLSHKKSPKSKDFFKAMNKKSQATRFGGKTKEEISEIMRQVRLKGIELKKEKYDIQNQDVDSDQTTQV